jgi:parvulin-like peptidyl-prolyl isomerase
MFARHAVLIGICLGIAIILLLEGLGLAQSPPPNSRVALVNGEAITLAEVDAAIKQRPAQLTPPTAAQMRQLRLEMATVMVDDLVLRQFFREHGAKIDPIEINKQMAALEAGLKAQNKTLNDYFRDMNQTEAQVRANMLLLLQLDRYVIDRTTEADMKKYFELNKDYFDKVMVRTSHIVIRIASNASEPERTAAKQKLQTLRGEILAGQLDFAKAAQTHSQCPSAPKGGDIGFIYRKFQNVDEAYAKAAFAMKAGEISDVVESEFGYHLIKVTERNEGKPTTYEQSADVVRDCYAEDLRITLLNQLRKQAKVQITLP